MTRSIPDQMKWDLAGFKVAGDPVTAVAWDRPPLVEIKGDRLHWRYVLLEGDDDPEEPFPVAFGPIVIARQPKPTLVRLGLLLEFVKLAEPDYHAISTFAGRWGVLHLCHHHLPRTHPMITPALPGDEHRDGPYCQTVYGEDIQGSEPIAGWFVWALWARAVLRIASTLSGIGNEFNLREEWAILLPADEAAMAAADPEVGKSRLSAEVERWLRLGDVRPRIDLSTEPHLRVGGSELFGSIALQLASATATAGGLAFCHECANAYAPSRQPATGRRNYCDTCREMKVPQRDAARALRKRTPKIRRHPSQMSC